MVPTDSVMIIDDQQVDISAANLSLFRDLQDERERLVTAVTKLNTVQRKGKVNCHVSELEEDDDDKGTVL